MENPLARPLVSPSYGPIAGLSPHLRHAAFLTATIAACLLRNELGAGNVVLWILGGAAALNLGAFLLSARPGFSRISPALSTLFALAGWTALVNVTGGFRSPFVAGLGFEVVLSSVSFPLRGALLALGAALGMLCSQQVLLGLEGARAGLALQSGLLAATGGVVLWIRTRWQRAHESLHAEVRISGERLRDLERQIEDLRVVGDVPENAARLAHGLKNAVRALRGFSRLIEERLAVPRESRALIEGLRVSVDRLEEIAALMLRPAPPADDGDARVVTSTERVIEEAIEEASLKHSDIRWVRAGRASVADTGFPARSLREILQVLLDNAAEAMSGKGEVRIETRRAGDVLEIDIRDQGGGIPASAGSQLFRPGRTTKAGGSGFGLFLARRLAEAQGGRIEVRSAGGPGATFAVKVPLARSVP
ncbi:MAG TPA: HAMP domain-containing sensor histidine kinase [Candidatus Saccharimonadales bacterium]|nr:HAMP domain-containing sensor histidine kinase [Candidatus Saccharimonadales bacterium]